MSPISRSPSRKALLRSGRVREVASDPVLSNVASEATAAVMAEEDRRPNTSMDDRRQSTAEVRNVECANGSEVRPNADERPLRNGDVELSVNASEGVNTANASVPISKLMSKVAEFEKAVNDCEKSVLNTMASDQNRCAADGLSSRVMSEILDRLAAIEVRLRREENAETRKRDIDDRSVASLENVRGRNTRVAVPSATVSQETLFYEDDRDRHLDANGRYRGERGGSPVQQLRLPRGGWLRNPFEELKYSGKKDAQNAMRFVTRFERIADYEGVADADRLYYLGRTFVGAAATWFELHDFDQYEEARAAFLEQFWGEAEQSRFRQKIYTGRYRPEKGISMADYVLENARQAKLLIPPMSEYEIIRALKTHFPLEVAREIRATTVSNLNDMCKLLNCVEEEKNLSRRTYMETRRGEEKGGRRTYPNNSDKSSGDTNVKNQGDDKTDRPEGRNKPYGDRGNGRQYRNYDESGKVKATSDKNRGNDYGSGYTKAQNQGDRKETPKAGPSQVNALRLKRIVEELDNEMEAEQATRVKRAAMPVIRLKLNELEVDALIDTGAQISAITRATYDRIVEAEVAMNVIPIRKFALKGAFSDKGHTVANKIQVTFVYDGRVFEQEFYIVEKMAYDAILGMDFLYRHGVTMCCQEGWRLTFGERDAMSVAVATVTLDEAEAKLRAMLERHAEMFDGEIGKANHYRHCIEITSTTPFKRKTYPVAEKHREAVAAYLAELERKGIVRKQATQYINPLVVVVKRDGRIRVCLDARELNKRMSNDHAQPPTIDEVFRRIGSKKYFTTLDISDAFWQIPLEEESTKYVGFLFDGQSYVFRRMPFGLKTAGASFTRAMNLAIGDMQDSNVIVYLDDVLIASDSAEQHLKHVNEVLNRLKRVGFKLNGKKCEFMREEITFLGHTFKQVKAEINEETKRAIMSFQQPKNRKGLQSFLGLVNWDRRFIPNLARLTGPLEKLLRKGVKYSWREAEQKAFVEVKKAFEEADELYLTRPGYKFGMCVDASYAGLGAMLYQYREEQPEMRYTIAYASRSLKGAEVNYTVTELECLAIVWALRKWHTMLLGRHVRVHTDHKALKFLETCVSNNSRIARWFVFLQEFDLEIIHVAGKENERADALSRSGTDRTDTDSQTRRIAVIRDPEAGADTGAWIDFVRRAQRIEKVKVKLQRQAEKRKVQRDKRRVAPQYQERDLVWCKIHRRSNAKRRTTGKIHVVYQGPYQVMNVVRPNAYEIADLEGNVIGVFNNRQLRPHRSSKYVRDQEREVMALIADEEEMQRKIGGGGSEYGKAAKPNTSEKSTRMDKGLRSSWEQRRKLPKRSIGSQLCTAIAGKREKIPKKEDDHEKEGSPENTCIKFGEDRMNRSRARPTGGDSANRVKKRRQWSQSLDHRGASKSARKGRRRGDSDAEKGVDRKRRNRRAETRHQPS